MKYDLGYLNRHCERSVAIFWLWQIAPDGNTMLRNDRLLCYKFVIQVTKYAGFDKFQNL